MFSFFKKKPPAPAAAAEIDPLPVDAAVAASPAQPEPQPEPAPAVPAEAAPAEPEAQRAGWLQRLRQGLRKTSTGITQVFTGARIDEALYEELETALLMADTGVPATEYLLADLQPPRQGEQGHRSGGGEGPARRGHRRTAGAAGEARWSSAATRRR